MVNMMYIVPLRDLKSPLNPVDSLEMVAYEQNMGRLELGTLMIYTDAEKTHPILPVPYPLDLHEKIYPEHDLTDFIYVHEEIPSDMLDVYEPAIQVAGTVGFSRRDTYEDIKSQRFYIHDMSAIAFIVYRMYMNLRF